MKPPAIAKSLESFLVHVDTSGQHWLWRGVVHNRTGYGHVKRKVAGKWATQRAHRVSWELHNGPIPEGMCVLHHCDIRHCVKPECLFLGTRGDNNRDRAAKGRSAKGEGHGQAHLTEAQVAEIRALRATGLLQRQLADRYGVDRSTIGYIVRGDIWSHSWAS